MSRYDKMTKAELIAELERMGDEYCRQTDKVEADNHLIADLQESVFSLNALLDEALKAMNEAGAKLGIPEEGSSIDSAHDLLALTCLEITTVRHNDR